MELSSYQIVRKLATGGMAEIFLARHNSTDGFQRNLVIKRILPEFSEDPSFVQSFLDEAKLAGQLSHPNIVQIYDLGRAQQSYYIAMEYIKGFDISTMLRLCRRSASHLPVSAALRVFCDVCAGLDYAHNAKDLDGNSLGVVHRDVTPSNVIVSMEGPAKLVDFGIAKATAKGDGKTKTGTIKGKFAYLAPEQVLGKPIDRRVDVFACGIMLYELLTNSNPFRGETEYQSLQNIVNGVVDPISKKRSDTPPELDDVVKKALVRDPDQRYQSCGELMQAVELAATQAGISLSHAAVHQFLTDHETQLTEIEARRTTDPSGSVSGPSFSASASIANPDFALDDARSLTRHEAEPIIEVQERRPALVIGSVAVAVVALVAVAAVLVRGPLVANTLSVPQPPAIEVISDPPGAQVLVDGVLVTGETPLRLTDVEVGKSYNLRIMRSGFRTVSSDVKVEQEGVRTMQIALGAETRIVVPAKPLVIKPDGAQKKPTEKPVETGEGRLRVVVQPWGTVSIDGEHVGDTPFPARTLSVGTHKVTIENAELRKKVTRQVKVQKDKEIVLREDLSAD
jgi:serine/threonine-protein kinase